MDYNSEIVMSDIARIYNGAENERNMRTKGIETHTIYILFPPKVIQQIKNMRRKSKRKKGRKSKMRRTMGKRGRKRKRSMRKRGMNGKGKMKRMRSKEE